MLISRPQDAVGGALQHLQSQLPAAEVTLTDDVLDRIDQIAAPGVTTARIARPGTTCRTITRGRASTGGEDGLAGFCDTEQRLCPGLALWDGRDPILQERAFGLTGAQGNHGEHVKDQRWRAR